MAAIKHSDVSVVKLKLPTSARRILFLADMACVVTGLNTVVMSTETHIMLLHELCDHLEVF